MDVSVVVPVYNSAATLEALFLRTAEVLRGRRLGFEIIFVDDGSTDNSWEVIVGLKNKYGAFVRGFRLARNAGQQAATFCGLLHAGGPWVVTMDDDLQTPPEEIIKLLNAAPGLGADIVYGKYTQGRHNLLHRWGARIFRKLLRSIAPAFPDGSSFRLIKHELIASIPKDLKQWDYVDPVLSRLSDRTAAVDVRHEKRINGRSGYSLAALSAIALNILVIYSTLPLKIMMWTGFISAFVSFGLGAYYLVQKLTVGAQLGFSALIVTITFFSGVILISLGILGMYVSKIYESGSGRPAYAVKSII